MLTTWSPAASDRFAPVPDETLECWRAVCEWLATLPRDELKAIMRVTCAAVGASWPPAQYDVTREQTPRASVADQILSVLEHCRPCKRLGCR